MTRLVTISLALLALGCGTSGSEAPGGAPTEASASPTAATLGEVVVIRQGESARIAPESLTLAFRAVGIDSRCPTDVNCVWEGNADVHIEIVVTGYPGQQLVLNTSIYPRNAPYREYQVELRSLAPEPRSDVLLAQREYIAQLIVTRR